MCHFLCQSISDRMFGALFFRYTLPLLLVYVCQLQFVICNISQKMFLKSGRQELWVTCELRWRKYGSRVVRSCPVAVCHRGLLNPLLFEKLLCLTMDFSLFDASDGWKCCYPTRLWFGYFIKKNTYTTKQQEIDVQQRGVSVLG